jgi:hypothetical protein
MRSIQHAPVFEMLMNFCFKGCCRRVEMQDFGLLSTRDLGGLDGSFDGTASTKHKEFNCCKIKQQFNLLLI